MQPDPMQPDPRGPDGIAVLRGILKRRKWVGILTFAGGFAAVASVVTFLPDIYRSSATVLIERQQIPADLVRSTVTGGLDTRLPTLTQEILSRSRLEGLIDRFGLYADLKSKKAPLETIIDQMRQDIEIEMKSGARSNDRVTIAFAVGYRGRDPQKVALVANTLASFYIEENLKVRERQAAGTTEFLGAQLAEMKVKLEEQEKQVTAFKEKHIGQLPQQLEANLRTLEQLNSQLRLNADNQVKVNDRRSAVAAQLAEAEGFVGPGGVNSIAVRLAERRKVLADLQVRYSDKYPDVINLKTEIAALEQRLQSGAGQAPSTKGANVELKRSLDAIDADSRNLKLEAERLRESIAVYQHRVEIAPKWEQEFQALFRDYETTKEMYRSFLLRQGESAVGESMEQRQKGEQFRVIEPALLSEQPAAPNRPRLLLYGLMLCLGLAAVVTVGAEQLDSSFHSSGELRTRTGLLVLSIPPILSAGDIRSRRKRFGLTAVAAAVGLAAIVGCSYLLARDNGDLSAKLMKKPVARAQ